MTLVSKSIPNFINGISQQPTDLRLDSQSELQENGLSDIVKGLSKRPPTKLLKTFVRCKPIGATGAWTNGSSLTDVNTFALTEAELNITKFHTYKRDNAEQYTVLIVPNYVLPIVLVYDIGGNLCYESNKGSWKWDADNKGTFISNNNDSTLYLRGDEDVNVQQGVVNEAHVLSGTAILRQEEYNDHIAGALTASQLFCGFAGNFKITNAFNTIRIPQIQGGASFIGRNTWKTITLKVSTNPLNPATNVIATSTFDVDPATSVYNDVIFILKDPSSGANKNLTISDFGNNAATRPLCSVSIIATDEDGEAACLSLPYINSSDYSLANNAIPYWDPTNSITPSVSKYTIANNFNAATGVATWTANSSNLPPAFEFLNTTYIQGKNLITKEKIAATSVADYTFLVNKDKVVAKDTSTPSFVRPHEGMFYIKQADYKSEYNVFVKNSGGTEVSGNVETLSNADPINARTLATSRIMEFLTNTTADGDTSDFNNEDGLFRSANASALSGISRNYTDKSPFCVLESTSTTFDMRSSDDQGDTNLFTHKDTTSSFIGLPKTCKDNFVIQVNGDNQKKEDDFYVQFSGTGNQGTWKECAAPSRPNTPVYHTFDTTTMPHTLSQNADLSFTFNSSTWDERKCGDEDTNPFPSFVGGKINDVFFHRNRLGFLSDENVIFSEASSYFNFFRVTVRSLLDSAPIDVGVSQNEVSVLQAAVPVQDNLLLFTELNQFKLTADRLLTPSEISIDLSTKYECDLTAKPVGAGASVFFPVKSGIYSGIREYYVQDDSDNEDAPQITSHVPEYIQGSVRQLVSSANEDTLICLTDAVGKLNECYVYRWYNSDRERIQSAWSKWIFSKDIIHVSINNATLYFTFSDGSYEELDIRPPVGTITYTDGTNNYTDEKREILLDHQKKLSSATTLDIAGLDVLYTATALSQFIDHRGRVIAIGNTTAEKQKVIDYINTGSHVEDGNNTLNYVYAGEAYTFKYQLSEQVFKPDDKGSSRLARHQLRRMMFKYSDTGAFNVEVGTVGRDTKITAFTGRILGQTGNALGYAATVDEGTLTVGLQSQAKEAKITITNNSHLPCVFQSAEVESFVTLRNRRI